MKSRTKIVSPISRTVAAAFLRFREPSSLAAFSLADFFLSFMRPKSPAALRTSLHRARVERLRRDQLQSHSYVRLSRVRRETPACPARNLRAQECRLP